MEILTKKQQVEKQAKDVFKTWQVMDNNLSIMKNRLSNYRDRLFKNKRTVMVMEYEVFEFEKATNYIYAYQALLYKELEILNKKPIESEYKIELHE